MRKKLAAFFAASLPILVAATPGTAAPTNANVRIEGKERTLFEGSVPVSIKRIKASSDTEERDCDGINALDPENVVPAATPTLASAEAMESIGETFDGQWYGSFDDYFITRWGPESQDISAGAYWGILVNEVYTNVGGCQYQLSDGDEVLWIWDAFKGRPTLVLYPEEAHYSEGPRPTTVIAAPGQPVPVEVLAFPDNGEGVPGDRPSRAGSSPYQGAEVASVTINSKGFQRVETTNPETVTTDAEGKAAVSFTEPGLHRIKATVGTPGHEETVVRSNGLTICIHVVFGDCGEVAQPPAGPASSSSPSPGAPGAGRLRISKPRVNRAKLGQGKVSVSWRVLEQGEGIESWRIFSRTLGAKRGSFVVRAKGAGKTQATIRLARGESYKLRLSVTDREGETANYELGKVSVPLARTR
jgi:hypothetical protein